MATASFLPAASRARRPSIRRLAARLAACASNPAAAPWLVIGFATAHAVLWTFILVRLKAAQDVHMDVAEAFAWGQKFQWGYGKHPPLAGWVAGLWFRVFPVADWATYALAMAVLGCGMVICWLIALRVVDRRRAVFVLVMLAPYPIFNFKGFKYNPDLLQLVTLPLLVLAYLHAFEKRSVRAGLWLGLAGALALMTKYWVLTMIGAFSAVLHWEDVRALRETKNRIHRLVNTEAANLERAASAAATQRQTIEYLASAYGLPQLSPPLREIAELRLAHPGESLAERLRERKQRPHRRTRLTTLDLRNQARRDADATRKL